MEQSGNTLSPDHRIDEMMSLVTNGFHNMDNNFRELRKEFSCLGEEVGGLKTEVEGLKVEVGGLKEEVGGLKKEFTDFKKETSRNFQDVNFKLGYVMDELSKIDLVIRYEEQYKNMRGLP